MNNFCIFRCPSSIEPSETTATTNLPAPSSSPSVGAIPKPGNTQPVGDPKPVTTIAVQTFDPIPKPVIDNNIQPSQGATTTKDFPTLPPSDSTSASLPTGTLFITLSLVACIVFIGALLLLTYIKANNRKQSDNFEGKFKGLKGMLKDSLTLTKAESIKSVNTPIIYQVDQAPTNAVKFQYYGNDPNRDLDYDYQQFGTYLTRERLYDSVPPLDSTVSSSRMGLQFYGNAGSKESVLFSQISSPQPFYYETFHKDNSEFVSNTGQADRQF